MSFTDSVKNIPRLPNGGGNLTGFLTTVIDPSRSFRITFNVSLTTTANPLLMFRMTPNGKYASAFNSQLTANSSQLTANG